MISWRPGPLRYLPRAFGGFPSDFLAAKRQRWVEQRHLADFANQHRLRVYSDIEALNVMLADPVVLLPGFRQVFYEQGRISRRRHLGAFEEADYDLVILSGRRLEHQGRPVISDAMVEAIRRGYRVLDAYPGRYRLLAPRDREVPLPPWPPEERGDGGAPGS